MCKARSPNQWTAVCDRWQWPVNRESLNVFNPITGIDGTVSHTAATSTQKSAEHSDLEKIKWIYEIQYAYKTYKSSQKLFSPSPPQLACRERSAAKWKPCITLVGATHWRWLRRVSPSSLKALMSVCLSIYQSNQCTLIKSLIFVPNRSSLTFEAKCNDLSWFKLLQLTISLIKKKQQLWVLPF